MFKNVNCIHADNPGGYCKNKNIKRSLFGIGARCCVKYFDDDKHCDHHKEIPRPRLQFITRSLKGNYEKENG